MDVQIGPEIVRSYKRLSYSFWHGLAEFIDNSIQSYLNNREELDEVYAATDQRLTVQITYGRAGGGRLVIRDNAMGMSEEELTRALSIGKPPPDTTGLSEFGMGMKTAACWFGDEWTVRTKRLGDENEQRITFNVEKVAAHDFDLGHQSVPRPLEEHFTEIAITHLNHEIHGRTIEYIRRFLRSMYRTYIANGDLALFFNGDLLTWRSPIEGNVHFENGQACIEDFEFYIIQGRKRVHGRLAVLERGSRSEAGLTIMRRGRVIKGWPNSWRPQIIFGQLEGSNDLVNQRLVGEVHLDRFGVSHTKDEILWEGEEAEVVEEVLGHIARPLIDIASSYRKRGTRGSKPRRPTIDAALGMLEEEIRSDQFLSILRANGDTPPERYEAFSDALIREIPTLEFPARYQLDELILDVFLTTQPSERDSYLGIEIGDDDTLSVVINLSHPHINDLNGRVGVLNHLKDCTYEGVAQWKVKKTWDADSPTLIRAIKDSLLRVGSSVSDPQ